MSSRMGFAEAILLLFGPLLSLLVVGWLLWLAHRAVRALESIAESLRQNRQP